MITHRIANGEVVYNDGSLAEVEITGVEGIEAELFLDTVQLHVEDTEDTSQQFQMRFPVGTRLHLLATTEITMANERQEPRGLPLKTAALLSGSPFLMFA